MNWNPFKKYGLTPSEQFVPCFVSDEFGNIRNAELRKFSGGQMAVRYNEYSWNEVNADGTFAKSPMHREWRWWMP